MITDLYPQDYAITLTRRKKWWLFGEFIYDYKKTKGKKMIIVEPEEKNSEAKEDNNHEKEREIAQEAYEQTKEELAKKSEESA